MRGMSPAKLSRRERREPVNQLVCSVLLLMAKLMDFELGFPSSFHGSLLA